MCTKSLAVRHIISIFTVHCTESLGVEHLSQVVGSQWVDGQDALVWKPPLAAGNEDRQQLTVCRDVTAGIVIDLTVWHQHIDGSWTGDKKKKKRDVSLERASKTELRSNFLACGSLNEAFVSPHHSGCFKIFVGMLWLSRHITGNKRRQRWGSMWYRCRYVERLSCFGCFKKKFPDIWLNLAVSKLLTSH